MEAQGAEEHPQLIVVLETCERICTLGQEVKLDRLKLEVPSLLEQYRSRLRMGRFD